jgi:hypothetical protein
MKPFLVKGKRMIPNTRQSSYIYIPRLFTGWPFGREREREGVVFAFQKISQCNFEGFKDSFQIFTQ